MSKRISKKILHELQNAQSVILTTHIRPDGDALGSCLALYIWLKSKNIPTQILVNDKIPSHFKFLPFIKNVQDFLYKKIDPHSILLVTLDCADLDRADLEEFLPAQINGLKIINIDHHASNPNFGTINLVDSKKSSTCEILYNFFKDNNTKINRQIAQLLLTGMVTDTDNFSLPNTDYKTMQVVTDLVRLGANLKNIVDNIYRRVHLEKLKLWGTILSRLTLDTKTGLATTAVFLNDLEKENFNEDFMTGFSNFLNNLDDVNGVLVLKEEDNGGIRGSLRTTCDDMDVAEIAAKYGGGGHKKASGFFTTGKIIQNRDGVWGIDAGELK